MSEPPICSLDPYAIAPEQADLRSAESPPPDCNSDVTAEGENFASGFLNRYALVKENFYLSRLQPKWFAAGHHVPDDPRSGKSPWPNEQSDGEATLDDVPENAALWTRWSWRILQFAILIAFILCNENLHWGHQPREAIMYGAVFAWYSSGIIFWLVSVVRALLGLSPLPSPPRGDGQMDAWRRAVLAKKHAISKTEPT